MTPTARKEQARDIVRVLAGTANNLRADNSINSEAKKTLDLTAKFLLDQIAAALQAAECGVWKEAAEDLSHGLPTIWKDALKSRCAVKAAQAARGEKGNE